MAIKTKAEIKSYFETGDIPTQSNFDDFIDTALESPVDNLTSTDNSKKLSANQGKILDDKITALTDGAKFLGVFTSVLSLPTTGNVGEYAYVDLGIGNDIATYVWDSNDNQFVAQAGSSTSETAASIKTKYESNADTNPFTDTDKAKLDNLEVGAEVNVQPDFNEIDNTLDSFIKNKLQFGTTAGTMLEGNTDIGKVGTKEVNEAGIADGKILQYDNVSGKYILVDGNSINIGITLPLANTNTNTLFFETDTDVLYFSNGTSWLSLN